MASTIYDDFIIYAHHELNVSTFRNETCHLAVIGYIINPLKPLDSNDTILRELGEKCLEVEDLLREVQIFSGSYVILSKSSTSFVVVGDAGHLRQINYGFVEDNLVVTSSVKLFWTPSITAS